MVVVITPEQSLPQEQETLLGLLEAGLERLHVRKPQWNAQQIEAYLLQLPAKFRNRVSVHGYSTLAQKWRVGMHFKGHQEVVEAGFPLKPISKSVHSWPEVLQHQNHCDYLFLSPIFKSISKQNYSAGFTADDLAPKLVAYNGKAKIIALGGIDANNAKQAMALGFDGVACLGALWQQESVEKRIATWKEIYNTVKQAYSA